jgi:hypothetical protein
LPHVLDATVIRFLIETDEHISIIAHRFHRLIADAHLEQTGPAENFGGKCAEGIDMIPPAGSSQGEYVATRDGSFARLAANTNRYFILH